MADLTTVLGTISDDTITTDNLKNFVVDALEGDDTIQIQETAESFTVKGMDGDDTITLAAMLPERPSSTAELGLMSSISRVPSPIPPFTAEKVQTASNSTVT